jgi:hypothetical protein
MTTRPKAFITSVAIEPSKGPHEYVSVWIRGQNVGTLCVGKGDGEPLAAILRGDASPQDAPVWAEAKLRPEGPWSTHQREHAMIAAAGIGAPAPSRDDASKAEVESRLLGVPSAAGAPPTSRRLR